MATQLRTLSNSPAMHAFSFNDNDDRDEEVDTSSNSSPEIPVAELPSPPTTLLLAADADVFGGEGTSYNSGLGPLYPSAPLVGCEHCGKPVLATALHGHAANCEKIRTDGAKEKTEDRSADSPNGSDSSGKRRRAAEGVNAVVGGDAPKKKKYPKTSKSAVPGGKGSRFKGPLDLDKQCGVFIEKKQAVCTRSITCKVHAMRDKRAVIGRSRPYDELVIAYKKILDPEWEEPPKKETKAERKEKKDKEKAEKRKKELEERGLTGAGGSAGADGSIGAGANGDSSVKKKKTSSKKKKDANGATINGAGGSGSGKDSSGKGGPDVGTADGKGGTSSGPNATNGAFDDEDEDYDSEAEAEALIEAVQRARGLPTTLPFALSAHQLVSATQPLLPPATPLSAVAPLSSTTVTTQALPLPTAVVPYAHALGTPLARPIGASSFFVARNEALRCCSDIVRSALGDGVGVSAVSSNSMLSSGPSSASVIATPRSGVGW